MKAWQAGRVFALRDGAQALRQLLKRMQGTPYQPVGQRISKHDANQQRQQKRDKIIPAIQNCPRRVGANHHPAMRQGDFTGFEGRRDQARVPLRRIASGLVARRGRAVQQRPVFAEELDLVAADAAQPLQKQGHGRQTAVPRCGLHLRKHLDGHQVGATDFLVHAAAGVLELQTDQQRGKGQQHGSDDEVDLQAQ